MKRIALLAMFFTATSVFAQEASKVPDISFRLVNDFFQIPSDMVMAEAVGVALNSKGHIFILNRGNHPILEFNPDGSFIGSFGEGSPVFSTPAEISSSSSRARASARDSAGSSPWTSWIIRKNRSTRGLSTS